MDQYDDSNKKLMKEIKNSKEVAQLKKTIYFSFFIWIIIICAAFLKDKLFGIITLIVTPVYILLMFLTYRNQIRHYLKNPSMIENRTSPKRKNSTARPHNKNKTVNTATKIVASYVIGKTVRYARKQAEIAKYGVKTTSCVVLEQKGKYVTYQAKCDNCGTIVGRVKNIHLNPSQKYFDNLPTRCPNCQKNVSPSLILTRK